VYFLQELTTDAHCGNQLRDQLSTKPPLLLLLLQLKWLWGVQNGQQQMQQCTKLSRPSHTLVGQVAASLTSSAAASCCAQRSLSAFKQALDEARLVPAAPRTD